MSDPNFYNEEEQEWIKSFEQNGYFIFKLDNFNALSQLRNKIYQYAKEILGKDLPDEEHFFNQSHDYISLSQLNDVRLQLISKLSSEPHFRPEYYRLAQRQIHSLVGNELAMQRVTNLGIQFPKDDSSLLPLHSDVWSGNSPYEIVFWLPLVDCWETKSMFILPRKSSEQIFNHFHEVEHLDSEEFYQKIRPELIFLKVPFGHGVIFTHSIIHGNRINEEQSTRWTFNIRFKGLLTPYGDKELGESFLPITMRPLTRMGYQYIKPKSKT